MEPEGEPQRVKENPRHVTAADWSPDTCEIVFAASLTNTSALFRIFTGHGAAVQAIPGTGSSAYNPTVSPESRRLANRDAYFHARIEYGQPALVTGWPANRL